jgi:hypothetical protein
LTEENTGLQTQIKELSSKNSELVKEKKNETEALTNQNTELQTQIGELSTKNAELQDFIKKNKVEALTKQNT